jgi:hypothetical protein
VYGARRNEKREAKAAARLLLAELGEACGSIAFALDENEWTPLASRPPRLPSWDRVSQTIAGSVRPATWRKVTSAAHAVELIAGVASSISAPRAIYPHADPEAPGDSDRTQLAEAQREIEEAILALAGTSKFEDQADAIKLHRELAERYP